MSDHTPHWNFTFICARGGCVVSVVDGREQPHECSADAVTSEREALAADVAEALHWFSNGGDAGGQPFDDFVASFLLPRGWSRSPRPAPAVEEVNEEAAVEALARLVYIGLDGDHRSRERARSWDHADITQGTKNRYRHQVRAHLAVRSDEAAVRADEREKVAQRITERVGPYDDPDQYGDGYYLGWRAARRRALKAARDTTSPVPSPPEAEDVPDELVLLALAAVDADSAGSWPQVASILAAEVRRLRTAPSPPRPERDVAAGALLLICSICEKDLPPEAKALPDIEGLPRGRRWAHRECVEARADSLARSSAGDPTEGGDHG